MNEDVILFSLVAADEATEGENVAGGAAEGEAVADKAAEGEVGHW